MSSMPSKSCNFSGGHQAFFQDDVGNLAPFVERAARDMGAGLIAKYWPQNRDEPNAVFDKLAAALAIRFNSRNAALRQGVDRGRSACART